MFNSNAENGIKKDPSLLNRVIYLFMIFITGLICVYDNVLSIIFAKSLPLTEINPLCRMIIDYGGVGLLIIIKSAVTIIGMSVLIMLNYTRFRICVVIIFFLALILFFYLTFYCPQGEYSVRTLIAESLAHDGPLKRFFDFYFSTDFSEAVDNLSER
tara:strand:+ start:2602 stop:3072 length:471 start_codon:yes stop_codon:yes gene_type:complete